MARSASFCGWKKLSASALSPGAEQFAFVGGDAGVEDAPVDVRPAAGFAGVEHVLDAFGTPLGSVGFEHPVGVGEWGGEGELCIGRRGR